MSWYPHANGSACKVITKILCTCNFRVTITTTLLLHVPVQQSSSTWATQGTIPWWACNKLVLQTRPPSLAATFPVNFKLSAQVHTFQPRCNQLARLQSVSTAAQCQLRCSSACIMSAQLHFVSSAAIYLLPLICCDRPAARHQLSYEVQDPLQSVISAAVCLLSHDMSAWQQSVSSVCQLSCNRGSSAAMCFSSAKMLSEGSVATCQLSCQVSCNLSAELHPISSGDTDNFSCNMLKELKSISSFGLWKLTCSLLPQLCSVSLALICQLNSHVLAQLHISAHCHLSSCCQLSSTCQGQVACTKAHCIQHRSYTISWSWHMLLLMKKRIKSMHA